MYKVPYKVGEEYQVCWGRVSSCEEGNIMAAGKIIMWKKGKGKQYHLPYNIEAVGKNIKWESVMRKGTEIWERKLRFKKKIMGKNINLQGTLYTTALPVDQPLLDVL